MAHGRAACLSVKRRTPQDRSSGIEPCGGQGDFHAGRPGRRRYVDLADKWAADIRQRMAQMEPQFYGNPGSWKNDIRFFRLGIVCWYVDEILHITYPDELANAEDRIYDDPMNVFVNGLMERRRGSCASMPVLHVALGWRLGWPVSLACADSHLFCRYDDGEIIHNIEATNFGRGGFRSHPDEYYREQYRVPAIAESCGSDLRAVTPREMLGIFLSVRASHFAAVHLLSGAELDFLLARYLFPRNRILYTSQMEASTECGLRMFNWGESGHPANVGRRLREWPYEGGCLAGHTSNTCEVSNANNPDATRTEVVTAG